MYPICLQRQREALAAADSGLRWHSEQRVYVPPNATRAQLSDVRIQLALLDRDFDYRGICAFPLKMYLRCVCFSSAVRLMLRSPGSVLFCKNLSHFPIFFADYDALRALDDDITPTASSTVGDEAANALPIHDNDSHPMGNKIVLKLVFRQISFVSSD